MKEADRIEKALEAWGVEFDSHGSDLSGSRYYEIDSGDETIRVRVSDHDLPESYVYLNGAPDIEVYTSVFRGGVGGNALSWEYGLVKLASLLGKPVPLSAKRQIAEDEAFLKRLEQIRENKIARERAEKEAIDAALADSKNADVAAEVKRLYEKADRCSGAARKKLRQRARKLEQSLIKG